MKTLADTSDMTITQSSDELKDTNSFNQGGVISISFSHALHDTYAAFLPPLLPVFISSLALTKTLAGLLTIFLRGPSILQPFIGLMADRVNLRILVILAPAITGIAMSTLGIASSYGVLVILLLVAGISSASYHAIAPVVTGRLSGTKLGLGVGIFMVGGELGRALGPLVIALALKIVGLEGTTWLMTVGILGSGALFLALKDLPEGVSQPEEGKISWQKVARQLAATMFPLIALTFVHFFAVSALQVFLPTFLVENGFSLTYAAICLSVLQITGMVGALLGGAISDRIGRRRMIAISLIGTTILMLVYLSISGWIVYPILVVLGLCALSVVPVILAYVQESFPENRSLANGIYIGTNFFIQSATVILLGLAGDHYSLALGFKLSAFAPLLGLPILLMLPSKQDASVA
jgi:FSR family fosmidomycin resistance protein-like MFS transporter